jgi:diguanylate cyclase (GGDEF)-like protein
MSADLVAAQSDELISVLEQLPEGVFVLDGESRVIFANKPGLRLVKMKPKKTIGQPFPYPVEDGSMRDFDVEMLVKPMTWGGQEARLVHLKPLKSAGAFHLEWKLESALEKARAAELLLEEWKAREGQGGAASASAELEQGLQESREQLEGARQREAELSSKLDEYQTLMASQRREFDDRMAELESLLELAETRADELQSEVVSGDHQTATELQQAVALAHEAEEQVHNLEEELAEARDRIRVAEEQAEVAEERAYSLEAELERLEGEGQQSSSPEELSALQQELATLQEQLADWKARAEESAARPAGIDPGELESRDAEISELVERLQAKEEELLILTDRVEAKEDEVAALASQLAAREKDLCEQGGQASARDQELAALNSQLQQRDAQLAGMSSQLQAGQAELAQLREHLQGQQALQSQSEDLQARLAELEAQAAELQAQLEARDAQLLDLQAELKDKGDRLEAEADGSEALNSTLQALRAELEVARQDGAAMAQALQTAQQDSASARGQLESTLSELKALSQRMEEAEDTLRVRTEESDELAEQLRAETEQSEELVEQLRQENERLNETLLKQAEDLDGLREIASDAESLVAEFNQLKATHEELAASHQAAQGATEEVAALQARVAELETAGQEAERLQKEVQKLSAQLDEVGDLVEKGEKADKLERKLEGALRRAEEAEERLQEERRLLAELRQTSERRISELENRSSGAGTTGEADPETERLAFQDPLTGLPNRNILHRYLGFMLKQSVRYERYTALLRIDCDKFKTISDTFGTEVGDRLIRLVGERLSAVVRGSDVLGRLGEDEFVILLSELTDQKEASVVTASVIKRIYQMLKKPFSIDDQNISVGVSIGVSLYPLDASNGEQMFQHSAVALKRAKDTGRGQAQYYTPEVQSSHETRMMIDHELKLGLERGEFGLMYQPIFDLSNGQIVGVEALIRWNHPRLGSIGPDEFLKVAEESGIIVLIGNWALRSALQKAAQWQQSGLGLFVSLNLSRRQLLQADLIPTIHTALAEFRCSPDRILLEISEELTGPELPRLRDTLINLQQLGVRLAVDNFGTSASSLQELRRGPFQVLKIDRRFVRGVPAHEENAGIVLSALTMGHHLGRITVAVGVETEAEKTWLAKTGCRFAQGNLLAVPLPAEHVSEIVARR